MAKKYISESKLNEIVNSTLKRCISEAMDDTFSYDELTSLTSFASRIRYCKQHLGMPIGNGSSRTVFQIDDDKCLKLAKNSKGLAQNGAEFDWYAQTYDIMPKIYDSSDDNSWIVCEYVLPAKANDFKVCLGIDFKTFQQFVFKSYSQYHRSYSEMSDEQFENLLENNEWLNQLYSYMCDYQVPCGDLVRIANLGMVQRYGEPQIVILDSGLTQQIWDDYYR